MTKQDDALTMTTKALTAQERQIVDTFLSSGHFSAEETAVKLDLPRAAVQDVLKRPAVAQAMALVMLSSSKERITELRDATLLALWQLSNWDPKDCFDNETGTLLAIADMPVEIRRAIKGFKHGRYGLELTFVDRDSIQRFLAKHLTDLTEQDRIEGSERAQILVYDTTTED